MDPKANMLEQVQLAREIIVIWDGTTGDPHTLLREEREDLMKNAVRLAELVEALDEWRRKGGFDPYQEQEQELSEARSTALIELLWPVMKKDPEHKDRVQTGNGWGTKTKVGLVACIQRIVMGEPRR